VLLATACGASTRAAGEIVVLVTGEVLKVEAHQLVDGSLRLELPGGGSMMLDLGVVERVVDDEVVPRSATSSELLGRIEVGFDADQRIPDTPWGAAIHDLGRQFGLNPQLIAAVVEAESAFDADALSHKGAQGLMQIMPATADRFGVPRWSIFEPEVNLEVGVRYLAVLRERYDGDLALMLAAYNAGEATVERYGGVPPYRETQGYLRRIQSIYSGGAQ
jgi:hypothetical protein